MSTISNIERPQQSRSLVSKSPSAAMSHCCKQVEHGSNAHRARLSDTTHLRRAQFRDDGHHLQCRILRLQPLHHRLQLVLALLLVVTLCMTSPKHKSMSSFQPLLETQRTFERDERFGDDVLEGRSVLQITNFFLGLKRNSIVVH